MASRCLVGCVVGAAQKVGRGENHVRTMVFLLGPGRMSPWGPEVRHPHQVCVNGRPWMTGSVSGHVDRRRWRRYQLLGHLSASLAASSQGSAELASRMVVWSNLRLPHPSVRYALADTHWCIELRFCTFGIPHVWLWSYLWFPLAFRSEGLRRCYVSH